MGSGSKSSGRKRSRSASHEKEIRHKHHKDRKRERSKDDSVVNVSSKASSAPREPRTDKKKIKFSNERDFPARHKRHRKHHQDEKLSQRHRNEKPESSPSIENTNNVTADLQLKPLNVDSPILLVTENRETKFSENLSFEETNKVRAKLGLKPLETNESEESDGKKKDDLGEFYHKPAENIGKKIQEEKIRSKLSQRRTKRSFDQKLCKVALLGAENSEDDDDVETWISKSRKLTNAKEEAEKTAKMLEEVDEQLGAKAVAKKRNRKYSVDDIKGLQVDHDINSFKEGETVILTLEDKKVLDDSGDVLVNINILEDEQTKKNNENKKKLSFYSNYNYGDEDFGSESQDKPLLAKYDEEKKQNGYKIGIDSVPKPKPAQSDTVKDKLLYNLTMSNLKMSSDYYNEEELTKFKKPKKKIRKVRAKPEIFSKENEEKIKPNKSFDVDDYSNDMLDIKINVKIEGDEEDLNKIKRVREFTTADVSSVEDYKNVEKCEFDGLVFNPLAEFCRNLCSEPDYENSVNQSKIENEEVQMEVNEDCKWKQVDLNHVLPIKEDTADFENQEPILEEEPNVGLGVAAALKLAMSKGYLDKEVTSQLPNARFAYLNAQNYTIEDKNCANEKAANGNHKDHRIQKFQEKESFKPDVKLEYFDDQGNVLDSKEAFRYMSHKFHGVGSGKNKLEKRLKKSQQEKLIKKMNSIDTPLGTVSLLQAKQKETQSPYIVLSGKRQTLSKN